MPAWVAQGFGEYRKRLSHDLPLDLIEVRPGVRGKGRDDTRAMADEGAAVLAGLTRDTHVVALDGRGKPWSSEQLAEQLAGWRMSGRDLAFVIGGPDGHAECRPAARRPALVAGPADLAAHAGATGAHRTAVPCQQSAQGPSLPPRLIHPHPARHLVARSGCMASPLGGCPPRSVGWSKAGSRVSSLLKARSPMPAPRVACAAPG